jgi:hypothetical protein
MEELSLAEPHFEKLPDHSLTILDRGFLAYALLHRLATRGVDRRRPICAESDLKWKSIRRLGPYDQIVEIAISQQAWRLHPELPEMLQLRAIRYRRKGFRPQTLHTSLLEPATYPAAEIAQLYHECRELELGLDETKTHALERVCQEFSGLAIAYNLVRLHMQAVAQRAGLFP